MKANKFVISGLNDPKNIADIENSIGSNVGINAVRVDMQASTLTVDYDEGRYNEKDIENFVNQAGLTVTRIK